MPPSPHNSPAGNHLKLTCTARGLPTPTVQWFRGGVALSPVAQNSVVYSVLHTHTQCNLVYFCVAENNAGNVTHTVHADIIVNIIGNYLILKFGL